MLIGLMEFIGILYFWTWFIWPFVFVASLLYAIYFIERDEKELIISAITASISLLIILAGITSASFGI